MNKKTKDNLIKLGIGAAVLLVCLSIAYFSGLLEDVRGINTSGEQSVSSAAAVGENTLGKFNARMPSIEKDTATKSLTKMSEEEITALDKKHQKRKQDSMKRQHSVTPLTDITRYNRVPSARVEKNTQAEPPIERRQPARQVSNSHRKAVVVQEVKREETQTKRRRREGGLEVITEEGSVVNLSKKAVKSQEVGADKTTLAVEGEGIIYGEQHILNGKKLTVMLTKSVSLWKEGVLEAGTLIDGLCSLRGEFMEMTFSSVKVNGNRLAVKGRIAGLNGDDFALEHEGIEKAAGARVGKNILSRTLSQAGLGEVAQGASSYDYSRDSKAFVNFQGNEKVLIHIEP